MNCPVCNKYLNSDWADAHVNAHFEENNDFLIAEQLQEEANNLTIPQLIPNLSNKEKDNNLLSSTFSNDFALALQLQSEQVATNDDAEKELKELQEKYGLKSGSAWKQMEETLNSALKNQRLSPQFYEVCKNALNRAFHEGIEDDYFRTRDVISSIKQQIDSNFGEIFFSGECDHFASSPGDRGFGCGYRNTQMLLSAMIRNTIYFQAVFQGRHFIPSIFKLQQLIEAAWKNGFDVEGCDQLHGELHNTRKWIGPTEVACLLSNLRVRCHLHEFPHPDNQTGLHYTMFKFIYDYFHRKNFTTNNNNNSGPLPLYVQFSGHSFTVIGAEEQKSSQKKTAYAVWVLDPGFDYRDLRTLLKQKPSNVAQSSSSAAFVGKNKNKNTKNNNKSNNKITRLRRTLNSFKEEQYQILSVDGLMATDEEFERAKRLESISTRYD